MEEETEPKRGCKVREDDRRIDAVVGSPMPEAVVGGRPKQRGRTRVGHDILSLARLGREQVLEDRRHWGERSRQGRDDDKGREQGQR